MDTENGTNIAVRNNTSNHNGKTNCVLEYNQQKDEYYVVNTIMGWFFTTPGDFINKVSQQFHGDFMGTSPTMVNDQIFPKVFYSPVI